MDYLTHYKKLQLLKYYIEKKWANTPRELPHKLELSERTILRMIKLLKDEGVAIKFSRKINAYIIEL